MANDYVLTPGGMRPRSQVFHIEPGAILDGGAGRLRKLHLSGRVLQDYGAMPRRPAGRPVMPHNIVRPKTHAPGFGSGWITYASWTNNTGAPITSFSTTWVVPPAPATQSGQLIYLFNGIQNSGFIYQPVLQWGSSPAGGGNYWAVASWYVDGQSGPAYHSNLAAVNPGDVLVGVMTLTGQSPQGFSYNCEFQGIANTGFPVQNIEELTWLVETLECYGITQCSDYPATNKTAMYSINIANGNPVPSVGWSVTDVYTECGQHTLLFDEDTIGNGEVDIWYQSSPFWTFGLGTIVPGQSQDWWFTFGGNGDAGPQLIQAEPLNASGELSTTAIGESLDGNGNLTYYATVINNGTTTVNFQWRGGGR
jgi:hypothetical protein